MFCPINLYDMPLKSLNYYNLSQCVIIKLSVIKNRYLRRKYYNDHRAKNSTANINHRISQL